MVETNGELTVIATPDVMSQADQAALADAMQTLAKTDGLVVRLADVATGLPARIGARGLRLVPGLEPLMAQLAQAALTRAFEVAILRLPETAQPRTSRGLAVALVGTAGALGGFAGFAGFVPDAFVTTLAIMRTVASIAQAEGEDLSQEPARLACLSVFAASADAHSPAGGPDLRYFLTRSAMQGRPVMGLVGELARRYGLTLSQKFAMQAVPFVGAAAGAALNLAYLSHYQTIARAVFTIRRLERRYGASTIRSFS